MLWSRADGVAARRAATRFGQELLRRGLAPAAEVDLSHVCGRLAHWSINSDQALEYLGQARQLAVAHGTSPALFMLNELPLRVVRGETPEATQLLKQLQRDHIREPGVAEALYHMLERFGLVRPEPVPGAAPAVAAAEPAPAAALWTAGSPEAAQEAKPSKLWLPD